MHIKFFLELNDTTIHTTYRTDVVQVRSWMCILSFLIYYWINQFDWMLFVGTGWLSDAMTSYNSDRSSHLLQELDLLLLVLHSSFVG